jgi:hypothetical protein
LLRLLRLLLLLYTDNILWSALETSSGWGGGMAVTA